MKMKFVDTGIEKRKKKGYWLEEHQEIKIEQEKGLWYRTELGKEQIPKKIRVVIFLKGTTVSKWSELDRRKWVIRWKWRNQM